MNADTQMEFSLLLADCAILGDFKVPYHFLHYPLQLPVLLLQLLHPTPYALSYIPDCNFEKATDPAEVGHAGGELLKGEEVDAFAEMCSQIGSVLFVSLNAPLIFVYQIANPVICAFRGLLMLKGEKTPADVAALWRMR